MVKSKKKVRAKVNSKAKPKEPKKLTKKRLASMARTAKRKKLSEWSKAVRARDNNQCVICGKLEHIQAHHLIPKERFPNFMFEVINGISICPSCHKYGAFSFHRHPFWSVLWMELNRPDQFEWVMERSIKPSSEISSPASPS